MIEPIGKITKEDFNEKLLKIKEDLSIYFEGLPLESIEFILRDFRETTLRSQSILTVKKS